MNASDPPSASQEFMESHNMDVYWAVQPGGTGTRPVYLLEALTRSGFLDTDDSTFHFHGGSASADGWIREKRLFPGIGVSGEHVAKAHSVCFSPAFSSTVVKEARWVDMYDDWTLAPDINPLYRIHARSAYRKIREKRTSGLTTCNTPYMARLLGLAPSHIVPNGVPSSLARLRPSADETSRLIVQGHFFRGRTDYDLIVSVAESGAFSKIVFCGDTRAREMQRVLGHLRQDSEISIHVLDWIDDVDLPSYIGANTVALVPNIVSDYTLSQDVMKAYKYLALGLRVICPRLLWPSGLPNEYAFLIDFGAQVSESLADWLRCGARIDDRARALLVAENSWDERAARIMALMGGPL